LKEGVSIIYYFFRLTDEETGDGDTTTAGDGNVRGRGQDRRAQVRLDEEVSEEIIKLLLSYE
jgi:hypothetical protein